jgi:FlaA1/EpsC-like NDP-sugar epimerase
MLVVAAVAHLSMISPRVFYRCVEELVHYLKLKGVNNSDNERIVLYGAGGRCQLFLKERGFNNSSSFDNRIIVGLIDDEPSLHFQWVYGHLVLGGFKDLHVLIDRHKIKGIVITTKLKPESFAALRELTAQHGLFLAEWAFEVRNASDLPAYVPELR